MTLEPRMLAVEERLQRLSSSMPAPDVEAGWAALSAKLEPPLAQVIPLRRKSFGRPILLAAAAALLVAGSAFAAVTHGTSGTSRHVAPAVGFPSSAFGGVHLHDAFTGPSSATAPSGGSGHSTGSGHSSGTGTTSNGGVSTGSGGGSGDGTQPSKPKDDPNDRDQGTGNDGQHNDRGGGNNGAEGTQPRTSNDGGNDNGQGQGQGH